MKNRTWILIFLGAAAVLAAVWLLLTARGGAQAGDGELDAGGGQRDGKAVNAAHKGKKSHRPRSDFFCHIRHKTHVHGAHSHAHSRKEHGIYNKFCSVFHSHPANA